MEIGLLWALSVLGCGLLGMAMGYQAGRREEREIWMRRWTLSLPWVQRRHVEADRVTEWYRAKILERASENPGTASPPPTVGYGQETVS